jgi:hypothetical protein
MGSLAKFRSLHRAWVERDFITLDIVEASEPQFDVNVYCGIHGNDGEYDDVTRDPRQSKSIPEGSFGKVEESARRDISMS